MTTTPYTTEHREVPAAALLTIDTNVASARGRSVIVEIRRPADSEDARHAVDSPKPKS
ncbi:MAG: hypothetical protein ACOX1P_17320 [Thermoguttaceae bacterium]|jgi:hypothetical protein